MEARKIRRAGGISLVLGLVIPNADEVGFSEKLSLSPAPLLSGRGMPKVE